MRRWEFRPYPHLKTAVGSVGNDYDYDALRKDDYGSYFRKVFGVRGISLLFTITTTDHLLRMVGGHKAMIMLLPI